MTISDVNYTISDAHITISMFEKGCEINEHEEDLQANRTKVRR